MTTPTRIRVIIVDDHDMLRRGLITFLDAFPDLEFAGEASNGRDAIELCATSQPDVALVDLKMPIMEGIEAIPLMKAAHPDLRVIALTSFSEPALVQAALKAGADSYLLKNVSATALAEAIRACRDHLLTFAPEVTSALTSPPASRIESLGLTSRERVVLSLLVKGKSNDAIAEDLQISKNTAKNHVGNVLWKLSVRSRGEAVAKALASGFA